MSLVNHFFPDKDEAKRICMVHRLMETAKVKRVVKTNGLAEVLQEMRGTEDGKLYSDLHDELINQEREEIIMQRLGAAAHRRKIEQGTPSPLKKLQPPKRGAILHLQLATSSFQGYYPRDLTPAQQRDKRTKKVFSTSRTFGPERTQETALLLVVKFLWKKHEEAGHNCDEKPSNAQVTAALERSLKILAGEEEDEGEQEGEAGQAEGPDEEPMADDGKDDNSQSEMDVANEAETPQMESGSHHGSSSSSSSSSGCEDESEGENAEAKAKSKATPKAKGKAKGKNTKDGGAWDKTAPKKDEPK